MGILSIFSKGRDKRIQDIERQVVKARGEIRIATLKGQTLYEFINAMATSLHTKWIQKTENKIDTSMEHFEKNIGQHLVIAAEGEELKAVHSIVKDYMYLYMTLLSFLRWEMKELKEFKDFVDELTKFCNKKKIDKNVVAQMTKEMEAVIAAWVEDLDRLRQIINSVFKESEGKSGWALSIFNKMHHDGYFMRREERSKFKETVHDKKKVLAALKKVKSEKIKSIDDLKAIIGNVEATEKEMAMDFELLYKMLFNTWDNITAKMAKLLEITQKAVSVHELPERDLDDMRKLHNIIVKSLEENYLHSLRIGENQLEGELSDVKGSVQALSKAA